MTKKYELSEEEQVMASEPVTAYASLGEISTTEALWALIINQARDVQMTIKNRLDKLFPVNEDLTPYTMEELLGRIEEAEKEIEAGDVIPGEEVHKQMRDYVNSFAQ